MTLTGIANSLAPQDPAPLLTHLGNETNEMAGEFAPPPPAVMRAFIKFAFKGGGLKLEFDRSRWRNHITVKGRTVTITNAPEELTTALSEEV
jgi:nucleoid-associated protein YejK